MSFVEHLGSPTTLVALGAVFIAGVAVHGVHSGDFAQWRRDLPSWLWGLHSSH